MTQTAPAALAPPTTQPLEPIQRLHLRDQLQDLWRAHVEEITELAVRFHSVEFDDDRPAEPEAIAKSLSRSRLTLTEIEAAMGRLDVGRYGTCERCLNSIPFADLVAVPHRRCCTSCDTN